MQNDRRHFTEAARAAAAIARAKRAALKAATKNDLEVFVLRPKHGGQDYTWQIRKFGGLIVAEGEASFPSIAEARRDGLAALIHIDRSDEVPAGPHAAAQPLASAAPDR